MPDYSNIVRLQNAVIPEVYTTYTAIDRPELTAIWASGIVASNPFLDSFMALPGSLIHIPYWKDLDENEPNYGNDDPDDEAPIDGLGSGQMQAAKAFLNKAYGSMDLVADLAGSNPMQRIRNRFGVYWTRQWQRRLISTALGVYRANVAGNFTDPEYGVANDMVIDISGGAGAAGLFSREAFVDAAFTMGDHVGAIVAIAVHSVVYKRMTDNDDIEFIPDSKGQLTIPTYMGKLVIVDDGMPVLGTQADGFKYVSFLFGAACFGYAEGTPQVPAEIERKALRGHGSGMEYLIERKEWLIHPGGWNWTNTTVTGGTTSATTGIKTPKNADLALAVNWQRTTYRKNVPMAFLVTTG